MLSPARRVRKAQGLPFLGFPACATVSLDQRHTSPPHFLPRVEERRPGPRTGADAPDIDESARRSARRWCGNQACGAGALQNALGNLKVLTTLPAFEILTVFSVHVVAEVVQRNVSISAPSPSWFNQLHPLPLKASNLSNETVYVLDAHGTPALASIVEKIEMLVYWRRACRFDNPLRPWIAYGLLPQRHETALRAGEPPQ